MNTNNNNTATPNNGVAVTTKEMLRFEKDKISQEHYEKMSTSSTFPYVMTKKKQVIHYTYRMKGYDEVDYYKQFLCSPFRIKEVYQSEKNGSVMYLTIEVLKDDKWYKHKEVPLSQFSTTNLHELKKYGIAYNPRLKDHVESYATMLIDYKKVTKKTYKLGWVGKSIDKLSFFGFKTASYEGDTPLLSTGDYQEQLDAVNDCIEDSVGCQLAIAISLSSALLMPLKLSNIAIDPAAYHFYGSSSTGKTTVLKLASSMWTNPLEKGLMNDWNSTGNGLMALLNNNYGATVCFDEISMASINLTDFIYSLSQGADKTRCSPNGILPTKTWCTNIMSSGEKSFSSKVDKQGGMNARIIEFMDLQTTNSEEHSKQIQETYTKYYGCIGKKFVKFLPNIFSQLETDFNKWKTAIASKLPSGNINQRVALQYACVCLAAEYAQAIGILIEPERILKCLIENHKDTRSSCEVAYSYIIDYLKQKQYKFPEKLENDEIKTIEGYYKNNRLVIFKDVFERIIGELHLDVKLIAKEFDDKGILLEHENDRLSKRVVIGNSKHTVYVIKTDYDFGGGEAKNLDTVLKGPDVSLSPVKTSITGQRRKLNEYISA